MYPHFADGHIHFIKTTGRCIGHRHTGRTGLCRSPTTTTAAATSSDKNSQQKSHHPHDRLGAVFNLVHASPPVLYTCGPHLQLNHLSTRPSFVSLPPVRFDRSVFR